MPRQRPPKAGAPWARPNSSTATFRFRQRCTSLLFFTISYPVPIMKNINNEEAVGAVSQEKQVKKLMVLAAVGLRLARQIQKQLQEVEDSVEILTREILRQAEQGEEDRP